MHTLDRALTCILFIIMTHAYFLILRRSDLVHQGRHSAVRADQGRAVRHHVCVRTVRRVARRHLFDTQRARVVCVCRVFCFFFCVVCCALIPCVSIYVCLFEYLGCKRANVFRLYSSKYHYVPFFLSCTHSILFLLSLSLSRTHSHALSWIFDTSIFLYFPSSVLDI